MKKTLLLGLICLSISTLNAQTIDTVSMGPGYANNKWYSLTNDEQASSSAANWDLAFSTGSFSSALLINESVADLYVVNGAAPADFLTIDTTGISSWDKLYNSDTTWEYGAFNRPANGDFDYGFGTYNMVTHNINANRVFIYKYKSGSYKKLYIQMNYMGTGQGYDVVITSANLDNSDQQEYTFNKLGYASKNFVYYSFADSTVLDREPARTDWDLLMTRFIAEDYNGASNQLVTGILHNTGVSVAEARDLADADNYTDYQAHEFQTNISTIGWDWKVLDYTSPGFPYIIEDSLVYFVKTQSNEIYKVIMKEFIGSSAGSFIFSKERLLSSGIFNSNKEEIATLSLYPNPNSNGVLTVVYEFQKAGNNISLSITDLMGRTVYANELPYSSGLQQTLIPTSDLSKGVYIVNVRSGNQLSQQKLVIN